MELGKVFNRRKVVLGVGVVLLAFAALNATRFFTASSPAAADFSCPADTECPYDSSGSFIGYKNPWPQGCAYIIPGLPASESGKQTSTGNFKWNQADRNSSTTAPQCYPEDVSAYGFKYYGRGVRMHNVGVHVDRTTGLVTKFNADGSFAGTECFFPEKCGNGAATASTSVNEGTSSPVDPALANRPDMPGFVTVQEANSTIPVVSAAPIAQPAGASFPVAVGTTFKYTSNDAVYYLDNSNCKKRYASWDVLDAWGVNRGDIVTVWDSMQYPDCASPLVDMPSGK